MRRRKLIAVVGLALVVAVGVLFVPGPRPDDRITRENYWRIYEANDITRAEVEAILGPPGDYTTKRTRADGPLEDDVHSAVAEWRGDHFAICVAFRSSGRMLFVQLYPNVTEDDGPLETILWRAKRLWRRWFPE
jgi:hypothetical protein